MSRARLICCFFSLASSFGEVFVALDIKTLERVALKTMDLNENYEADLVTEIMMMKALVHANIVRYIDSCIVGDKLWVCDLARLIRKFDSISRLNFYLFGSW